MAFYIFVLESIVDRANDWETSFSFFNIQLEYVRGMQQCIAMRDINQKEKETQRERVYKGVLRI